MSNEVDFCMQINMSLLQIDTIIMMGMFKHSQWSENSKFAMSLQYLKKNFRNNVDFLHAYKHQSFLQVNLNTLLIKVSCKVKLSLLMGMIKHSQSTHSNKFVISFQYLKKEVRNGVRFLHPDKHHR